MKSKIGRCSKQWFSLVISFSLIFCLIGCSPRNNEGTSFLDSEAMLQEEISLDTPDSDKISDNGQPIYDFDEFVNGELYSDLAGYSDSITYNSTAYLDYIDHVKEILESADISSLSEEDALYKVVILYNELTDYSNMDSRSEAIKAYLEQIDDAGSLNDLYDLYSKPEYAMVNYLINISVRPDYQWNNISYIVPKSEKYFLDKINDSLDIQNDDMTFRQYLNDLGYDDSRIDEFLSNAFEIEEKIDAFLDSEEYISDLYYYNSEGVNDAGLTVPVIDIVGSLNGYGTHGYILCNTSIIDFYNTIFVRDNVDKLKDYLFVSSLWVVYFSGYDFLNVTQAGRALSCDEIAVMYILNNAPDVIAREVMKKYYSDQDLKEINSLLLQVKTASIGVITGVDWLSDDAKELAKVKISRLTQYIGQNGHNYFLNGYLIDGNPVNDLIGLRADALRFEMIQSYFSDTDRAPFGHDVNSCTALYYRQFNCLLLSSGMLCDLYYNEGESPEEKLGYLGAFAAHEIGHSSDSLGILYDETGYYDPIITDDDYDAYMEKVNLIKDFFDGKLVYDDCVISGDLICDETYEDLFDVRTCLNILAETEDADLDLFFRTYARTNYGIYGENDIEEYSSDVHLMAKARINYVLGQFDEFYETYDIDETSPYYIPAEERLRIF